jgi:biopolymer transport protein ExbD
MTKPQINVTPLIDVLLVLLVIFMVVTPMKPSAFEARIPTEPDATRQVDPHPDTLVVTVGIDSTLRLNNTTDGGTVDDPQKLTDAIRLTFEQRIRNMAFVQSDGSGSRIERTVFIKAPRGLDYGSVARVVDAVKAADSRPISLQIDGLE